jgi:hypothetical protein
VGQDDFEKNKFIYGAEIWTFSTLTPEHCLLGTLLPGD